MKPLLVGALLLWSCIVSHANPVPAPNELVDLADYVMRGRPSRAAVLARAEAVAPAIAEVSDPTSRLLFEASRQFLIGFGELGNDAIGQADARFDRVVDLAQRANALGETSEGYRILADAHNQLLDIRPPAYRILNAGKARRAAVRAVELEPANPLAHVAAAGFFVNAPAIAGGSLDRGRHHLAEAASHAEDSDYMRFLLAVWEGQLAAADGRDADASRSLARAHEIYPHNWWLERIARDLDIELPR